MHDIIIRPVYRKLITLASFLNTAKILIIEIIENSSVSWKHQENKKEFKVSFETENRYGNLESDCDCILYFTCLSFYWTTWIQLLSSTIVPIWSWQSRMVSIVAGNYCGRLLLGRCKLELYCDCYRTLDVCNYMGIGYVPSGITGCLLIHCVQSFQRLKLENKWFSFDSIKITLFL